mmetsp:Transcript_23424/g.43116  ORF Transcript_23424/g.43116 Transcript_23424/m.43116 type:complete len:259 (-) Transcript_23424:1210-1986(-)
MGFETILQMPRRARRICLPRRRMLPANCHSGPLLAWTQADRVDPRKHSRAPRGAHQHQLQVPPSIQTSEARSTERSCSKERLEASQPAGRRTMMLAAVQQCSCSLAMMTLQTWTCCARPWSVLQLRPSLQHLELGVQIHLPGLCCSKTTVGRVQTQDQPHGLPGRHLYRLLPVQLRHRDLGRTCPRLPRRHIFVYPALGQRQHHQVMTPPLPLHLVPREARLNACTRVLHSNRHLAWQHKLGQQVLRLGLHRHLQQQH